MEFSLAYSTANELYGVEADPDDLVELALIAWKFIGNSKMRLYRTHGYIDPRDNSFTLPCEAYFNNFNDDIQIESVTYRDSDYSKIDHNGLWSGDNMVIEEWSEMQNEFMSPFYDSGKFAKYEIVGRKLYFRENYGEVFVTYRRIVTDNEGLPEITDKEAIAIATFIAKSLKLKEGWRSNNPKLIEMANYLEGRWLKLCSQARMPDHLSQNDMDAVLDATVRSDRKVYNRSFKPIR